MSVTQFLAVGTYQVYPMQEPQVRKCYTTIPPSPLNPPCSVYLNPSEMLFCFEIFYRQYFVFAITKLFYLLPLPLPLSLPLQIIIFTFPTDCQAQLRENMRVFLAFSLPHSLFPFPHSPFPFLKLGKFQGTLPNITLRRVCIISIEFYGGMP